MFGIDDPDRLTTGEVRSQLIGHLPPAQARAIELTKVEGRSIAETADITGQSESAVKVNVHRGLKKLAALVESQTP